MIEDIRNVIYYKSGSGSCHTWQHRKYCGLSEAALVTFSQSSDSSLFTLLSLQI